MSVGKTDWFIPDCYYPADGTDEPYVSHEAVCVLNTSDEDCVLDMTLYFEDREPAGGFTAVCAARRTHHIRLDKLKDIKGKGIERGIPYAMWIHASAPVIIQYSRLDTTQERMAFMTAMAYHAD